MLITFLIATLALVIAIVGCALLTPGYHIDGLGRQEPDTADWESSI